MNLSTFKPEEYPIVVQVIKGYLSLYQPDFDYRVMEPYRPDDHGQTEMMIVKMRRELISKAKMISDQSKIPSPSKSKGIADVDTANLSTQDVSRLLGVAKMTVIRLADSGTLPCKKTLKGHRRFKRSDVEKLLSKDDVPTLATNDGKLNCIETVGNVDTPTRSPFIPPEIDQ